MEENLQYFFLTFTLLSANCHSANCCRLDTSLLSAVQQGAERRPASKVTLSASYFDNPERYPKLVNYDAIYISAVADIPNDYYGEMCVPVTFMQKYNPKQFEIIGSSLQLGKPIKDFVEKDAVYEKGGNRFYLALGNKYYRRLWDRMIIKRRKED